MSRSVNVAIVGAGLVGSAFINQLMAIHPAVTYNVIVIARSTKALISKSYEPLELSNWTKDLASASAASALSPGDLAAYLEKSPAPVILVDNTSNEALARAYPMLLAQGVSIATPNKKAFSSEFGLWTAINMSSANVASKPTKGGLVYHEATVGAGLPVISTLKDLVATGDEVVKIEGIVSGTLSYIFNVFSTPSSSSAPVKFSDVVLKAKELGYTEPDPREDLNGLDVARKLTILARLSGVPVQSPTSFPVESLIPRPLEEIESVEEFLSKLPNYDDKIEARRKEAAESDKVLRFVGKLDVSAPQGSQVKVGIESYSNSHPFASLKGSDNVIAIYTKRYGDNPLIIQGAGAGAQVTAMGVLGDVLKIGERITK
ncbi:homoserine dehydrogenase-domain-containing protein [Lipomyces oligophaga]|uniref:homoserine dehydrogenase-domain-containing protein n=1 Tax=Lipomyces oligophaga TaxID=45792 RepID=UPI0034CF8F89